MKKIDIKKSAIALRTGSTNSYHALQSYTLHKEEREILHFSDKLKYLKNNLLFFIIYIYFEIQGLKLNNLN